MKREVLLTLILLVLLTILMVGCTKPPQQDEVVIETVREEQSEQLEEREMPNNFPLYPGAIFSHYFEIRGTDVFEYSTEDHPDIVYANYSKILADRGYELKGEATAKYADIEVKLNNAETVYIEAELEDDLTKIRISFFPREFMVD